jgi:hypothetical protein
VTTARDDYPALSDLFATTPDGEEIADFRAIFDEIDRLRRWQAEAREVIARWDRCHDLIPETQRTLGASKSENVFQYLLARARVGNPAGLKREPNV